MIRKSLKIFNMIIHLMQNRRADMGKIKLTKDEVSWVLYDVGNSAFTLLVSTLFPVYFNAIAKGQGISSSEYLAYWGYAMSAVTIIVAILAPVCGTIADTRGYKKKIFFTSVLLGVAGCFALGLIKNWIVFIVILIIAKTGYAASLVFYDSMIGDITTSERMDTVSSKGYAWGYIGSCVPFIIGLALIMTADKTGIGKMPAMTLAFIISALWWMGNTVPLMKNYKQVYAVDVQEHVVRKSFQRLWETFRNARHEKEVFLYLLSFFFYIDGVYTIIDMATAYGTALGLDTTGLLLALLVTQFVAFPSALIFGRLAARFSSKTLIPVCILAYACIACYAYFLNSQVRFWILAVCVGMFQGGIQALSRSHFAKIIPKEKSGEYFGLFDICGKGASFMGTMIISVVSQATGKMNIGVGLLSLLFIIGFIVFKMSCRCEKK